MNPFRKADFEPHISTVFEVLLPDQTTVPLALREIKAHDNGSYEGFSLMFTGSPECVFRHDTYVVKHPVLGEYEIFLGPVHLNSGEADTVHYQAVFSSLK